jgi:putative spermidine/putrescine transport system permease protein
MKKIPFLVFICIAIYLAVPLLATALYAISTSWNNTIFPEGLTLKWLLELIQDGGFLAAFMRSTILSGGAVLLSLLLVIPAICIILLYFPRFEKWLQIMVVLIYSFPGIILSVGIIRFYSGTALPLIWAVVGVYIVIILPYMYQGTKNSLTTINGRVLMDAAQLLGASKWTAFRKVLLPSIYPGLFVATLLSFSILFGEFVLINLVVGAKFKTIQIYLMETLAESGHIASAIVLLYVIMMAFITFMIVKLTTKVKGADIR